MAIKIYKTRKEKIKNSCLLILSFLMSIVIIMNSILIVKLYIFHQEIPDIGGMFLMISLTDESSPDIKDGDLVLCEKVDAQSIKKGDLVVYFYDNNRTKIAVSKVEDFSENIVSLSTTSKRRSSDIVVDRVIGKCNYSIPLLGFVMNFISTIPGFLLCVIIPSITTTEIYLYFRRKKASQEEDEETKLLAELEKLKEEQKLLKEKLKNH